MEIWFSETAKDKLLKLMNEKGLKDVFFVMDYADGDSPFYDEGGGCHCQVNERYHLVILKKGEEGT
ncbi:iron-sulfur cluster biosynthesis family protein [Granulicatella adiacens]|uniref:iron-sulfur cluster biosynthesis family protein n=1 Tax=Granulicatella adiacens TaxID=46124 RepID=UPI003C7641FD